MTTSHQSPEFQLMKCIIGKWISKPIYAAAELGIADLLAGGPMSIEELAKKCGAHERSLHRMMRALASMGIFHERGDGGFELTAVAELLRSDAMSPIARMFNAPWNDEAWIYFLDGVRTGKTPFLAAHGKPLCLWLEDHPHEEELLTKANAVKAAASLRAILDAYDFSEVQTLVDVGGGDGTLMAHILASYPAMKGIVADTPSVINKTRNLMRSKGLEHRCAAVACDFFEHIPPGGDAYLMSKILHDWDDERCTRILETCLSSQRPGSRLLVVESVIPEGNEPSVAKLLDLEMFVVTGGMERTESEYRTLLESSGYEFLGIIPAGGDLSILECKRR